MRLTDYQNEIPERMLIVVQNSEIINITDEQARIFEIKFNET